jgi:hypothetical protein
MLEGFVSPELVKPVKVWLQRVAGYGELTIPDNYPASSSTFSLDFSEEDKAAIVAMEANIGTDESIVKPEDLPENTLLGEYVGTFDVNGEAGVETLLSPVKLNTPNAVAYHYNEEGKSWDKIEDAHVVDGYVYGTLDSFSPIAVFGVKRDTYLDTSNHVVKRPLFVANGIPVIISLDENGKTVVKDANGKVTELPSNAYVIGGTVDGSNLDSTSVTVKGGKVSKILAGSFSDDPKNSAVVKKAVVNLSSNAWVGGLTGTYYASKIEEFVLNANNSYVAWIGNGESIWQDGPGHPDAGSMDVMNLSAKQYVKKFTVNADGLTCPLLFLGGNCGLTYTVEGSANLVNSNIQYLICGGSNGGTDKTGKLSVRNSKIQYFQTNNRGFIKNIHDVTFTNCEITNLFVAGDSTDSSVTGTTGFVEKIQVSKSTLQKLYAGTQGGKVISKYNDLAKILGKIVISTTTKFEFGEEHGNDIFGDLIKRV